MPKPTKLICALTLALVAAACGGAAQPGVAPTTAEPAPVGSPGVGGPAKQPSKPKKQPSKPELVDPRAGGFEVGFGEFAITTEAKAIRPGKVTFLVRNGGTLTHGLEMKSESDGGSNRGHGGGDDDGYKVEEPTFDAGESFKLTVTLSPGLYELECYVGNHDELGMKTILRVDRDAPLVERSAPAGNAVRIEGFSFAPTTIQVSAGTKVTWENGDPAQHTVTAQGGGFGSDPLAPGATFSMTFDQPGEFIYVCAIHPAMKGTVKVTM